MVQRDSDQRRKGRQVLKTNLVGVQESGMHGRGSQASAPTSDAAGRGDAGGTPQTARPCRVVPHGNSRIGPTRPKSGRLGPYRPVSAESGRNSKKKKKKSAKRTV